jgi:hypothetical protein
VSVMLVITNTTNTTIITITDGDRGMVGAVAAEHVPIPKERGTHQHRMGPHGEELRAPMAADKFRDAWGRGRHLGPRPVRVSSGGSKNTRCTWATTRCTRPAGPSLSREIGPP